MARAMLSPCGSLAVDDMAALEAIGVHGSLFNTIPSSSRFLVYVFSSVGLVVRLRKELKASLFPPSFQRDYR
ncbi:prostacyclin synthase [Colletotrichum graminicola]|nr:prostacyclin synthase [Colletotrichum graminicola]